MRAHRIAHHSSSSPTPSPPSGITMYALPTSPNRLCENCGDHFLSCQSFLPHGKCTTTSDDLDLSLLSSPPCRASGSSNNSTNWSKRKRSLRLMVGSPASNQDEDLANCLIMLSNGAVEPMSEEGEGEESCASASQEDQHHLLLYSHQDHNHHRNNYNTNDDIRKPINFIPDQDEDNSNNKAKGVAPNKGMFECKACKKVFNSHQALGGHRASHKKVKGCFAARVDHMDLAARENDDVFADSLFPSKPNSNSSSAFPYENGLGNSMASTPKRKTKVHECTICRRIFSSGQALGGHKRCHWISSNAAAPADSPQPSIAKFRDQRVVAPSANFDTTNSVVLPLDLKLDLNLPAPDEVRRPAFEVSTEIHKNKDNNSNNTVNNHNVELAKFSELKDMNMSGRNCPPWLQVGIGSTTDVRADP